MAGDDGTKDCLVYTGSLEFEAERLLRLDVDQRRNWYSHKFHGFGLKYEIASCIKTGDIVHFVGPFRCAIDDVTIYRSFLKDMLRPGEKVMADKDYSGDDSAVTPCGSNTAKKNHVIQRIAARHETLNSRLFTFGAMKATWRHDLRKHLLAFRACLVMSQLRYENGHWIVGPLCPGFDYGGENGNNDSV